MIRFSALLVGAATAVLISGVVTSSLLLVYVSIAVCAIALFFLAIGVFLHRREIFAADGALLPLGPLDAFPTAQQVQLGSIPLPSGRPAAPAGGPSNRADGRIGTQIGTGNPGGDTSARGCFAGNPAGGSRRAGDDGARNYRAWVGWACIGRTGGARSTAVVAGGARRAAARPGIGEWAAIGKAWTTRSRPPRRGAQAWP